VNAACAALGAVVALSACGGEKYRYVESDDGHMFARIPKDWEVKREGAVDYTLIQRDNMVNLFAFTEGDSTEPWRAEFNAGVDKPAGYVESQHVDARFRSSFLLSDLIESLVVGAEDLKRERVRVGDLEGYRVTYTKVEGEERRRYDELYLIDARKSGVYRASLQCDEKCHQLYGDEIEGVLTTFRVEP
ncbi:MAG TPA: hypothetical protein VE487_05870, partial [Ilumatobacter sp.]|nr:hypothetical protein [Ilumatobacter sp.]